MPEAAGRGEGETCADGKLTWVVDRQHNTHPLFLRVSSEAPFLARAVGEIVAVPREQPHPSSVAPRSFSEKFVKGKPDLYLAWALKFRLSRS
jgi:hypothetical protein